MFEKIPGFVTKFYPKRIWQGPAKGKKLYLTFDDGPIPELTPWVLRQLKKYNAKASFFCIGNNIGKYPEIFNMLISEGHSIGNHTYNHLNGWKTAAEEYVENVLLAEEIILKEIKKEKGRKRGEERIENREEIETKKYNSEDRSGEKGKSWGTSKIFRPPYGKITGKQAKLLQQENYNIIMWDVLSKDYKRNISPEKCIQNVLKNTVPGSIIVFHDSKKAEKNLRTILPLVLEYFHKNGFVFEKL